ncbi:MAG: YolD-like family protein [Lachnospiraceae bacterium]
MSREDRAKQFLPFAALKGHEEALRRKEKIIVPKIELSEEMKEELDQKFAGICKNDMITVTYFCDGEYLKKTGLVSRLDPTARIITVVNTKIPFDDIYDVEKERDGSI